MLNNNEQITIRKATASDLDSIIKIEQICFPPAEAASDKSFRDRFKVFGENFIVAIKNNQVIGFINGATTDKEELPDELYHDADLHKADGNYQTVFGLDVLPEYRKNGIGAMLIKELIDISKKRGKIAVVLTCKNEKIHYYEKFGFVNKGVSESSHGGAQWNDMTLYLDK
ncbi:GNAT family N-acetyltransferase [Fusobacterium sp. PH5-44]|uniref:GNAT family N-acetyltransferase n=1 Tax=unclassified Fusobacterium TaxID=2648384 RepID=UPI003D1F0D26